MKILGKHEMPTYKINLKEQTVTSINGITFKLTETKPGEYEGVCLHPKDISPDDLDDVILGRMIKEAGMFYKMELERKREKVVGSRIIYGFIQ